MIESLYTFTTHFKTNISDPRSYEHFWTCSWNKTWKQIRSLWDLNPWPLRYRCSVLPTELTSQLNKPSKWWIMTANIYENHICALKWRNEYKRSSVMTNSQLVCWLIWSLIFVSSPQCAYMIFIYLQSVFQNIPEFEACNTNIVVGIHHNYIT